MTSPLSQQSRRTTEPPIAWLMKLTLERPQLISLAAGFTDSLALPVAETSDLLPTVLNPAAKARATLQYGSTLGDPVLRKKTASLLATADGQKAPAAQALSQRLMITHGSQQFLYLATEALCDPGDIVILEDPTYFVYLGILQSRGVHCRGVPLEEDGLQIQALEAVLEDLKKRQLLPKLKLIYLVTYFHNPAGITTSLQKKRAVLQLLQRYEKHAGHRLFLLEDAAYRGMRFSGPEIPSALTLPGARERVLYTGTYSKPFATGVRIGYGIAPALVFTALARLKGNHDFGTSNLLQRLMAAAVTSGRYQSHLPEVRERYSKKAAVMLSALAENFPQQARWAVPQGGMYVWVHLPSPIQTGLKSKLFKRALEENVLYVPGEFCYASDSSRRPPRSNMRLSFGGATETEIREGIKRLGRVLRPLLNKR